MEGVKGTYTGGRVGKYDCEVDQSNVKHIESINVHRGLLINSMNLRSYSQKKCHILGHKTG